MSYTKYPTMLCGAAGVQASERSGCESEAGAAQREHYCQASVHHHQRPGHEV